VTGDQVGSTEIRASRSSSRSVSATRLSDSSGSIANTGDPARNQRNEIDSRQRDGRAPIARAPIAREAIGHKLIAHEPIGHEPIGHEQTRREPITRDAVARVQGHQPREGGADDSSRRLVQTAARTG